MSLDFSILNAIESLKYDISTIKNKLLEKEFDYVKVVKCIVDDSFLTDQIKIATLTNSKLQHHIDIYDRNCYSKIHDSKRIKELWKMAENRNKYKRNPRELQHLRGLLGEDVHVELINTVYKHFNIPHIIEIDETIRKDTDHGEDFRFGSYILDTKYRHHKGRELALRDKNHIRADILLFVEGECEIDACICENFDVARTTTLKGYIFKNDFCKHANRMVLRQDQSAKWVLPAYRLQDMNFLVRIALAEFIKSL